MSKFIDNEIQMLSVDFSIMICIFLPFTGSQLNAINKTLAILLNYMFSLLNKNLLA